MKALCQRLLQSKSKQGADQKPLPKARNLWRLQRLRLNKYLPRNRRSRSSNLSRLRCQRLLQPLFQSQSEKDLPLLRSKKHVPSLKWANLLWRSSRRRERSKLSRSRWLISSVNTLRLKMNINHLIEWMKFINKLTLDMNSLKDPF